MYWNLLFIIFIAPCNTKEAQYECGEHGRFEYCIDGIPGCVIGCHCHPGYYFDTDTKICEPNTKLTQDFRRRFVAEPTRVQVTPAEIKVIEPTPTPKHELDEQVDAIAKDADDLGDWLYNQFFKTVENQVINKTEEETPTRRSGGSVRKSKKKSSRKKTKKKNDDLRRKLLRITEDDSLFDSSSGSDEDSGSSSNSGSVSVSSESETSVDVPYKKPKKPNRKHGHRKIIMFNKKPKPPLPSFIFVPNIETPYYPPIGLPPPPAVPMYPVVPVPPMPIYPYQGLTTCDHEDIASSSTTITTPTSLPPSLTTSIETTEPEPLTEPLTDPNPDVNPDTTTEPEDTTTPAETKDDKNETKPETRLRHNLHIKLPRNMKYNKKNNGIINRIKGRNRGQHNKLLQQIRNRVMPYAKKLHKQDVKRKRPSIKDFFDHVNAPDDPIEEAIYQESLTKNELNQIPMKDEELNDVSFKYLSQLIHRIDPNHTGVPGFSPVVANPKPTRILMNNINNIDEAFLSNQSHRRYNDPSGVTDNSFYSKLGRDIATLVRTYGEHDVKIEIEQDDQKSLIPPIFNGNSYASRSYWERSVRSPIKILRGYNNDWNPFRNSNEYLFNLENKVEFAATTKASFSLQELENIVNDMKVVQPKSQHKNVKVSRKNKNSDKRLNINLLPQRNSQKNQFLDREFSNLHRVYQNVVNKIQAENRNYKTGTNINRLNLTPVKPLTNLHHFDKALEAPHKVSFDLQELKNVSTNKMLPKPPVRQQYTFPILHNYRNTKYYLKNNPNMYEKKSLPFYPTIPKYNSPKYNPTVSYFHHELHHFDYFD